MNIRHLSSTEKNTSSLWNTYLAVSFLYILSQGINNYFNFFPDWASSEYEGERDDWGFSNIDGI